MNAEPPPVDENEIPFADLSDRTSPFTSSLAPGLVVPMPTLPEPLGDRIMFPFVSILLNVLPEMFMFPVIIKSVL